MGSAIIISHMQDGGLVLSGWDDGAIRAHGPEVWST